MNTLQEQLTALAQTLSDLDLPEDTALTLTLPNGDLTVHAARTPCVRVGHGVEQGERRTYTIALSRFERPVEAGAHLDPEPDED